MRWPLLPRGLWRVSPLAEAPLLARRHAVRAGTSPEHSPSS